MKAVTPEVREKLREVERCHRRMRQLLFEIEEWGPDMTEDPETGWTFSMTIDLSGQVRPAHESEKVLLQFLNEYVPKPRSKRKDG